MDILKEILKKLPASKISSAGFEGANIVLYTTDKDFFLNNKGTIKEIVDELKKRIELRPDPDIVMDIERAEKEMNKIIPKEAGISAVNFYVRGRHSYFLSWLSFMLKFWVSLSSLVMHLKVSTGSAFEKSNSRSP